MPYGYEYERYGWVLAPWEKDEIRQYPDRENQIVKTALEQYGAGCLLETEKATAASSDLFNRKF